MSEFDDATGALDYQWQMAPTWGGVPNGDYNVQVFGKIPGDAIGEGKVDINDLTVVLANYGKTGCAWSQGAMDGDPSGTVDINDLTLVLANYGQTYSAGGPLVAVPEPGSILLCVLAALGLLGCRTCAG